MKIDLISIHNKFPTLEQYIKIDELVIYTLFSRDSNKFHLSLFDCILYDLRFFTISLHFLTVYRKLFGQFPIVQTIY